MRTAIVGGTGSIGMALAACLAQRGMEVVVLSRRAPAMLPECAAWRPADVTDYRSLRATLAGSKVERLVHLAALLQFACEADPAEAARVNVEGTANVLDASRDVGIRRVVFGSSIAVYGERSDPMRETDELPVEVGCYGVTKQLAESFGERFRQRHGLEFVSLRYSGVFGPGEAASAGMAQVRSRILSCARGEDVRIEGACGDERVHLTHVSDAAEATCAALLAPSLPPRAVYNVAGPPENYVSLRELHALVRELVPGAGRAIWSSRVARSAGPVDISRIARDLGWRPAVSLRDGLRELLVPRSRRASVA